MQFIIDEQKFEKDYVMKDSIKHSSSKNIKILPYSTKYERKHNEQISKFETCVGEFCRSIYNKKLNNDEINLSDVDVFIENVEAGASDKVALKSIIKEMFFDENGNLHTFHPKLLNYINMPKSDYNQGLAIFLYDILLGESNNEDIKNKIIECFDYKPENIMEFMILKSLPELNDNKEVNKNHKCVALNVSNLFKQDLDFILNKPALFIEEFENLLKYYYFFYVSQLLIKLSKFFDANKGVTEELYFNLDWETVSKSRTSYTLGWKMLESNLKPLFSHSNLLGMLNSNNESTIYDYVEISNIINHISDEDRNELYQNIKMIKNKYVSLIDDVDWDDFNPVEKYSDDFLKQEIFDFFKRIDYQFINSNTRKKPYDGYKRWFEEYCKMNYLRRRGSLGYTLNITQEQLLFITKLCIKDKDKIKLKDLFEEYKVRGIYFDRDSQSKIVELFEKLNIIEKKSDSGDAQYVKSIL